MNEGDFVSIDYIGRVKGTGEVFDLTMEDVAKKEKIFNNKVHYGPVTVIVGGNFIIKGLDEGLKGMKVNEKKKVDVSAKSAFGDRRNEMITLVPLSVFKQQKIDPEPGSYVNINNVNGRVVSIDGGRVKVDFNHPLAGKDLEYEVEIKSVVTDVSDKLKAIVSYFTGIEKELPEVKISGKEAEVSMKKPVDLPSSVKKLIADTALKWIKDLDKVKFVDTYGK